MTLEVTYQFEPYAEGACRVMVTLDLPRGSICSIQVGTDAWVELWRAIEPLIRLECAKGIRLPLDLVGDRVIFTGTQVPLP